MLNILIYVLWSSSKQEAGLDDFLMPLPTSVFLWFFVRLHFLLYPVTFQNFSKKELFPDWLAPVLPLTGGLSFLHCVPCIQYVLRIKCHHSLHLQYGGISQGMIHAVFSSARKHKVQSTADLIVLLLLISKYKSNSRNVSASWEGLNELEIEHKGHEK